ncbi:hypothetical protein PC115_g17384 [Phytophthora cactorum]|uniref:Uncharacterized protein n=1 Tax=Phytophthora cactorum TaxID=29920 RepID=A0A8T1B8A7_9STRA|nr:hypothetical protein PC115_g17384 [Phytophthora cactorum]
MCAMYSGGGSVAACTQTVGTSVPKDTSSAEEQDTRRAGKNGALKHAVPTTGAHWKTLQTQQANSLGREHVTLSASRRFAPLFTCKKRAYAALPLTQPLHPVVCSCVLDLNQCMLLWYH